MVQLFVVDASHVTSENRTQERADIFPTDKIAFLLKYVLALEMKLYYFILTPGIYFHKNTHRRVNELQQLIQLA